jgi:2-oxoglutarate ferredoxin oxidoreductase subunit beta
MLHLLRRNLDCQVLLFNNEIYGLTKGQYSPTSRVGTTSPSTPWGSVERPVFPCEFALGAGARFIARVIDTAQKQMPDVLKRAYAHKGTSFVEIYQNCVVYNDGVFEGFTDKRNAANTQIWLEHGKPMLFANGTKGLRINTNTLRMEVADVVDGDTSDIVVHDETNKAIAKMLVSMRFPEFPVALGVIFCDTRPSFGEALSAQRQAHGKGTTADLNALLRKGNSWEVRSGGEG